MPTEVVTKSSLSSRRKGRADRFEDLVRDLESVLVGGQARDQHRELVAAQARHGVPLADAAAQPLGHSPQQLVAGRVPERVVDDLESVEVEKEHREPLGQPGRLRDRHREPVVEEEAIGEPRQGVVKRQALDLFLRELSLRDVDHRALDDRELAVGPRNEIAVLEDPHDGAVGPAQAGLVIRQGAVFLQSRWISAVRSSSVW